MQFEELTSDEEAIGTDIVDAALKVHKALGPGLLEKIYEICLTHELQKCGHKVLRQVQIPIQYDGIMFDEGLWIDILVEDKIIIEVKAVNQENPVWKAQVLSHLKLANLRLGYLINFNVTQIKYGIKRLIL
jgi:GxxExxY protein